MASYRTGDHEALATLTDVIATAHPHLAERGAFVEVNHPVRGKVRVTTAPFKLSSSPIGPSGDAPYRPGEHSVKVLVDVLGYTPERVDDLIQAGVDFTPR